MAKATSLKKKPTSAKASVKKSAKQKSEKLTAPAPAEAQIAGSIPTTQNVAEEAIRSIAEAQASTTTTATLEREPAEQLVEVPKSIRVSSRKGKAPTHGIAALKHEALAAKDVYFALKACGCTFSESESSGMKKLVRFTLNHAQKIASGQKVDQTDMARTIGLARRVSEVLEVRFEGLMQDSFQIFDKAMKPVRENAPDLLVQHQDRIVELQDVLRKVIAKDGATYEETVDAYRAMMDYIPTISSEADKALKAAEQLRRSERQRKDATELAEEFEALSNLDF